MDRWFEEVENNTVPEVALYLVRVTHPSSPSTPALSPSSSSLTPSQSLTPKQVGTKLDKASTSRAVSVEEGESLATAHGARFCEASAKTTENVRKPFVEVVDMVVSNPALLAGNLKGRRTAGTVDIEDGGEGASGYLPGCSC